MATFKEPIYTIDGEQYECRRVLIKFNCFQQISVAPWHTINRRKRQRYAQEARAHAEGKPCKKVKFNNENDDTYDADVETDEEDEPHEETMSSEYGYVFEIADADESEVDDEINEELVEGGSIPPLLEQEDFDYQESPAVIETSTDDECDKMHNAAATAAIDTDPTKMVAENPLNSADAATTSTETIADATETVSDAAASVAAIVAAAAASRQVIVSKENFKLIETLRHAAVVLNWPGTHVEYLFKLLRANLAGDQYAELPKTNKTFRRRHKKNPFYTHYEVKDWDDEARGQFCYIGVQTRLLQFFSAITKMSLGAALMDDNEPHFEIIVNIDGLKLSDKGRMTSCWPIQFRVHSVALNGYGTLSVKTRGCGPTMLVAMYHGQKEPLDFHKFLREFVNEMIALSPSMPGSDERKLTCTMFAMIDDMPAREKCKNILGSSSKFPCERCKHPGTKLNQYQHSSIWQWQKEKLVLRTEEEFRTDANHVKDINNLTPLLEIPGFKAIGNMPLDTMHTVWHGGVRSWMKKLFLGKPKKDNALPGVIIKLCCKKMQVYKNFAPAEFSSSRVPPLNLLKDYKAAEMRHFVMYVLIPIAKGVVSNDVFLIISHLVAGLLIIGGAAPDPIPEVDLVFAQECFEFFIEKVMRDYYKVSFPPSLHNMLHIVQDLRYLGVRMDYIGAWYFENEMKSVTRWKRSNYRVIPQTIRRQDERLNYLLPTDAKARFLSRTPAALMTPDDYHTAADAQNQTPTAEPYIRVNFKNKNELVFPKSMGDFVIKANVRDAFCVIKNGPKTTDVVIVQCTDIRCDEKHGIIITGYHYQHSEVFDIPESSCLHHIYHFQNKSETTDEYFVNRVVTKLYALPDLNVLSRNEELNNRYPFHLITRPSQTVFNIKVLGDYPVWFGTGLHHILHLGASLY